MTKTTLIIISGPTGAGKTVIANALVERRDDLAFVKGTTTRPKTSRKTGDTVLQFVSEKQFKQMQENGEFLETATVHGYQYGTRAQAVHDVHQAGKTPLLVIDVQGHAAIRASGRFTVCSVFLEADSLDTLEQRIRARQPDIPAERVAKRLETAKKELKRKNEYDIVIVNRQNKLEEAILAVSHWIDSCKGAR